jgi:RNA polymerase sigma-70 factor (ECF subfamily)
MIKSLELQELFKAALAGDQKKYSEFLHIISKILRSFVRKRIALNDAEDVVQEILISIHKARHTYDGIRSIMPWIFAIARFRISDYLRKTYSNVRFENCDFKELCEILPDVTILGRGDEYIDEILKNTPSREKTILTMMYIEERSVKEVAANLKMTESAVKVAAHRAVKKIKKDFCLK